MVSHHVLTFGVLGAQEAHRNIMFDTLRQWVHFIRDPIQLIQWGGYIGLTLIIFAETGLLVGFFLPGDSLLVTAGLLAATGVVKLNLLLLILVLVPTAII